MAVVAGKFHGPSGETPSIALAEPSPDGNGFKVVVFPEPGGQYEIHNNVPQGDGEGEFSE
jgi:hypothetical protein